MTTLALPPRRTPRFNSTAELRRIRKLGFGAFAEVFEVVDAASGERFALKEINCSKLHPIDYKMIYNEIFALQSIKSSKIVKMVDFLQEAHFVYIVLEFLDGGSLFSHLNSSNPTSAHLAFHFFRETLLALRDIHDAGFIFRDLKPENILLTSKNELKICDFGWSCLKTDGANSSDPAGTLVYMAPEMVRSEPQDEKADVWGLGVLLYELLFRREPYPAKNEQQLLKMIQISPVNFANPRVRYPPEVELLIRQMLSVDKNRRPTVQQIL